MRFIVPISQPWSPLCWLCWLAALAALLLLPASFCTPVQDCDRCFECGPGMHEEDGVCVPDAPPADDDDAADDDDVADDDDRSPDDDDVADDDDIADNDDAAPGCDDWIVFVSRRTGTNQIWRMHSDGSELAQVTVGDGGKSYPALSPDCSQLTYVDTTAWELRVVDLDGANDTLVRAPTDDKQIRGGTWSPDGLRIAFDSTPRPRAGAVDGGRRRRQRGQHHRRDRAVCRRPLVARRRQLRVRPRPLAQRAGDAAGRGRYAGRLHRRRRRRERAQVVARRVRVRVFATPFQTFENLNLN